MKVVKVEVLPAKDNEVVSAVIIEETNKGGTWKETAKNTVQTGTAEARRTILLDEDDRVIIEGKVEGEVIYDHDQKSAKTVYRGERAKAEEEKDKKSQERFDKMNKEHKEQLEREKPKEAKLREEQAKERDEKIMGKHDKNKEQEKSQKASGRADYDEAEGDPAQHKSESKTGEMSGDKEAGLRTDVPADSKTIKDEHQGSTTKKK
jgi:hypothetical protein